MTNYLDKPWLKSYKLGPYKLEQSLAPYPKEPVFKALDDAAQIDLEMQKMQQRAATDAARIESMEDIADQRNDTNLERIEVQRQKMQRG